MQHVNRIFVTVGGLLFLGATQASAAGFMVRENSAESVATVFAGNASRADDASTVFNNPAGMSRLKGTQIEAGIAGVLPDMHFTGTASIQGHPLPSNNSSEVGQAALIPHLYGVIDLDDRTKLGLALTVPFGNTVDYNGAWSGRYVNIKTAALALDLNPNISYQITDRISIGGGVSAQYLKLQLSTAIAQSLILGPAVPDSEYTLNGHSWSWGYNFGILAEPIDGTRLGLTYRSEVSQRLHGSLKFLPQTSPLLGLATATAKAPIDLPASITASITQQFGSDLSLSSDVQFTQWNVFKQVSVVSPPNPTFTFVENYRDSWMVSVGGVYRINDIWSLRAGVGFDESPVTDAYRDSGVPDTNRYMFGIGPAIRLSDTSSLDAGYAYYFGNPATMNKSVNAVDPISGATMNGSYNNALHYLTFTYHAVL
jgi:long-chain fatty acid transport protein